MGLAEWQMYLMAGRVFGYARKNDFKHTVVFRKFELLLSSVIDE